MKQLHLNMHPENFANKPARCSDYWKVYGLYFSDLFAGVRISHIDLYCLIDCGVLKDTSEVSVMFEFSMPVPLVEELLLLVMRLFLITYFLFSLSNDSEIAGVETV